MMSDQKIAWFTWWAEQTADTLERLTNEHDDSVTERDGGHHSSRLSEEESRLLRDLSEMRRNQYTDATGLMVDRFRILGSLGTGGTAEVFEAVDVGTNQRVALKLMHGRHATPIGAHLFAREARVLARLNHPGVPRLFDYGLYQTPDSAAPTPYLVMELVEGESLEAFANNHELGWQQRVELIIETCDVVSHVHANMLTIRDLKADHIVVTVGKDESFKVRLLDLGTAATFDSATDSQRGRLFGTPGQMSPEQAGRTNHPVTSASDVYALGSILDQMLESVDPESYPPGLTRITQRAMSSPQARYPDIASLRSALEQSLNTDHSSEPVQGVRSSRRKIGIALLAFACVGVALGLLAIIPDADPPREQTENNPPPEAAGAEHDDGPVVISRKIIPELIGDEHGPIPTPYYDQVYAVSIGGNNLLHSPSEAQAIYENDANTMARLFQDQFAYQTETLIGDEATRANITHAIDRIIEAGPDDAVIVFIALKCMELRQSNQKDYAASNAYLICADTPYPSLNQMSAEAWEDNAISLSWLLEKIQALEAKHVLVLLNTGHSQTEPHLASTSPSINPRSAVTNTSRSVITAGFTNQKTNRPFLIGDRAGQIPNHQTTGNSVFVTALEQVLASNKAISAAELYTFLNAYMRDQTGNHWANGVWPQYQELKEQAGAFLFIPKTIDPLEEDEVVDNLNRKFQSLPRVRTSAIEAAEVLFAPDPVFSSTPDLQKQRWVRRIEQYRQNVGYGDPEAMAALSHCYRSGFQVQEDAETAFQWATLAHRLGSPSGTYALSRCYRSGTGGQPDTELADELLQKSAASGHAPALHEQSRVLAEQQAGLAIPDRTEHSNLTNKRITLLQRAAQAGFGPACHELAMAYLEGVGGLAKNRRKVEQWATAAIDAGDAMGHLALADLHSGRNGLATTDQAKVISHLTAAADAGIAQAQFYAGLVTLENGTDQNRVLPQNNVAQAVAWLEQAAQQGYSDADFELGSMYATGEHLQIDYAKAVEHMRRASAANNPKAMFALSGWYIQGTLLQQDTPKGVELLRKAADLNHAGACHILGTWYYDGKNVAADPPRGLYYLSMSARQDYVPALRVICQLFLYANPPWADSEQTSIKAGWRWHHESHKAVDAYRRFEEAYREEDVLLNKYLTTATEPLLDVVATPTTPQNQSTLYPVKETAAKLLKLHAEDRPEELLAMLLPKVAAHDRDERLYISILVHMDRKNGNVVEEVSRRVAADQSLTQESVAALVSSIEADRANR